MAIDSWVVLPPRIRREALPLLARTGRFGVARLVRNDFDNTRELVIRDLVPAPPTVRGTDFGPLDDLLLVRLGERVEVADLRQLLTDFAPTPLQLVAALSLGVGPAAGRWAGFVRDEATLRPLVGFMLVGAGTARLRANSPEALSPAVLDRWSRTRGALNEAVWRRVRDSRVAVVGAGRNGSAAALSLAMLGVSKLVLIDGDREEHHNLDATVGATSERVGWPKVEARRRSLTAIRPDDLKIVTVPQSLLHAEAVEALRGVDLIVTCVDRDAARLAAAKVANLWAKVHLDVGTGVFREAATRRMGGDVRLLLPGEACVACLGGLRRSGEARAELEAPVGALRRGPPVEWDSARAGSLVTLNQIVVNLGIQTWLDLLAGLRSTSCWLRLEWDGSGQPSLATGREATMGCMVCRRDEVSRGLRQA